MRLKAVVGLLSCALVIGCGSDGQGPDPDAISDIQFSGPTELRLGAAVQVSARAVDARGQPVSALLTFSTSDSTVVRVDGTGFVTVGPGTAVLTAASGTLSRTHGVRVTMAPKVAAGFRNTCALNQNGEAFCWGAVDSRFMLPGTQGTATATPTRLATAVRFVDVALANAMGCARTGLGDIWCWGSFYGTATPTKVGSIPGVHMLRGTNETFCALDDSNRARCWGRGGLGQLGNGGTQDSNAPVSVSWNESFVELDLGNDSACALNQARELICWGVDFRGYLPPETDSCGNGVPCMKTPKRLIANIKPVAWGMREIGAPCGIAQTLLYCWFKDGGVRVGAANAIPITQQMGWGHDHACGLNDAGAAFCFGYLGWGRLGDGGTYPPAGEYPTVATVAGAHTFARLSAGSDHNCGITTADELFCWGDSGYGETGVTAGLGQTVLIPTKVALP